jgi:hypothetical protein
MAMASKDDLKRKYAANNTIEEAEKAPPKKQKTMTSKDD